MNYYIITGASKGIGHALAKQLSAKNRSIVSVSRSENKDLETYAKEQGTDYRFIQFDLYNTNEIDQLEENIFSSINPVKGDKVVLINNAGLLQPIAPLEKCNSAAILQSIQVNYAAPMLLCAAFINNLKEFSGFKRIINISSGAGLNPYHGWSSYCTTKAALTMLTRCVALEQEFELNPVEVVSITPGVVETNMQEQIRASKKEDFANVEFFQSLKDKNKLKTPDEAAAKIISLIHQEDLKSGEFYDLIEL